MVRILSGCIFDECLDTKRKQIVAQPCGVSREGSQQQSNYLLNRCNIDGVRSARIMFERRFPSIMLVFRVLKEVHSIDMRAGIRTCMHVIFLVCAQLRFLNLFPSIFGPMALCTLSISQFVSQQFLSYRYISESKSAVGCPRPAAVRR